MTIVDDVFKRQQLFNVFDANKEGKGYFPVYWESRYKEWEKEGLVEFSTGYWLTDAGKKHLSAL
jgi:hypothetical protein